MTNRNKPSLSISFGDNTIAVIAPLEYLQLLSDHGFTHITLGCGWRSPEEFTAKELQQLQHNLEATHLQVEDVHGPHPKGLSILSDDPEERKAGLERIRQRLDLTHALGGDAMVYHVPTEELREGILDRYIDGLQRLEDHARNLGVIIAIENHWKLDIDRQTFEVCFEKFDSSYIGFTFDTGHATISKNLPWIVDNCMDRLSVLHINDNNGTQDFHWIPYCAEGAVDWDAAIQGIAKSPYRKALQLEIGWDSSKKETPDEYLAKAYAAALRINNQVNQLRNA